MATESFSKNFKVSNKGVNSFVKKMTSHLTPLTSPKYKSRSINDLDTKQKILATLNNK